MQRNAPETHDAADGPTFGAAFPRAESPARLRRTLTAKALICALLTCVLSTTGLAGAAPAFAETTEIDAQPDALQQQIESTAAAYDEATARVEELERQIADNEAKIKELQADLPEQRERGAEALRALYKLQQEMPGVIEVILNAKSLGDFLTAFEYIDHIQRSNVAEIERLQSMTADLETSQSELEQARESAASEQRAAENALAEAQRAREEAQRRAQEEAARQAEEEARASQEEAAKAAEEGNQQEEQAQEEQKEGAAAAPEGGAGQNPPAEVQPPSSDGADWSSDKASFVAEWGGRIDAYLAGSPLAGQGSTFAEAAWNYGIDPRWSPAIANTESSKGAYCSYPHNAWGWGSVSWGSWEEAINAHVRGLASGYGYTISVEAAKKYCPPNWEHWYNATLGQMNLI